MEDFVFIGLARGRVKVLESGVPFPVPLHSLTPQRRDALFKIMRKGYAGYQREAEGDCWKMEGLGEKCKLNH